MLKKFEKIWDQISQFETFYRTNVEKCPRLFFLMFRHLKKNLETIRSDLTAEEFSAVSVENFSQRSPYLTLKKLNFKYVKIESDQKQASSSWKKVFFLSQLKKKFLWHGICSYTAGWG